MRIPESCETIEEVLVSIHQMKTLETIEEKTCMEEEIVAAMEKIRKINLALRTELISLKRKNNG